MLLAARPETCWAAGRVRASKGGGQGAGGACSVRAQGCRQVAINAVVGDGDGWTTAMAMHGAMRPGYMRPTHAMCGTRAPRRHCAAPPSALPTPERVSHARAGALSGALSVRRRLAARRPRPRSPRLGVHPRHARWCAAAGMAVGLLAIPAMVVALGMVATMARTALPAGVAAGVLAMAAVPAVRTRSSPGRPP